MVLCVQASKAAVTWLIPELWDSKKRSTAPSTWIDVNEEHVNSSVENLPLERVATPPQRIRNRKVQSH
jgi:hypothetical protein